MIAVFATEEVLAMEAFLSVREPRRFRLFLAGQPGFGPATI
jgi:hypothetical protein